MGLLQRGGGGRLAGRRLLITEAGGALNLVERLALVTVLFLFHYMLVIVSALKLRGQDETEETFRANTLLLVVGLLGNAAILGWSVYDDPAALLWCAALIGVGVVLFLIERYLTPDR